MRVERETSEDYVSGWLEIRSLDQVTKKGDHNGFADKGEYDGFADSSEDGIGTLQGGSSHANANNERT
jgi:hypothetical protein